MSADNGIYIMQFKDQARVIYAQAIDNLYWSFQTFGSEQDFVPVRVYDYYRDVPAMTLEEARAKAFELEAHHDYLEYGISSFSMDMTWDELRVKAKEQAALELAVVSGRNDGRWDYDETRLHEIMND